jgi:hypothetical protein
MIERFRRILRQITGISTPLGGISWNTSATGAATVPMFAEAIYITYPENHRFILFLEDNDGKIVFLNACLDASVALAEQLEAVEREALDLDLIASGRFSGVLLPLPNREGRLVTATFHFCEDHVLTSSAGGTGILTVDISGFFEVSRTFRGGPTTAFHLKEVDAPLDLKVEFLNRSVSR